LQPALNIHGYMQLESKEQWNLYEGHIFIPKIGIVADRSRYRADMATGSRRSE